MSEETKSVIISKEAWAELNKEKIEYEDKSLADTLDRKLGIRKSK